MKDEPQLGQKRPAPEQEIEVNKRQKLDEDELPQVKDEKVKVAQKDSSDDSDGDQLFGDNTVKTVIKEEKKQSETVKNEVKPPSVTKPPPAVGIPLMKNNVPPVPQEE